MWSPPTCHRGRGTGRAQAGALSRRARADFLRAAVFRWSTPWVTARSRVRIASCTAVFASAGLDVRAARADFTVERLVLRAARLRWRRFSLCFIRLIADRVLATDTSLL